MTQNPEDIARMEAPCQCDCGEWFDLEDGWGCDDCHKVVCDDCYDYDTWLCKRCKELEDKP